MNAIATILITSAVLGAPTLAQDLPRSEESTQAAPQAPRTPAPPATGERQPAEERERTAPPPPPAAPPPPSERRPAPVRNVKVDVTISDQAGTSAAVKKVVSMVVADGRSGGVRSNSNVPVASGGANRDLLLNVDASVNVTPEQKVLLELKFNYSSMSFVTPIGAKERPAPTNESERAIEREVTTPRPAVVNVNEALTMLVTPGAPAIVARSADAAADRTVTVEVKVEIIK